MALIISMNWQTLIVALSLVGLFLLYLIPAISVTRQLLASDFFDPWQMRMQLLIVWLVPILGTALVAAMLFPHISVKRGHTPLLELLVLSAFVSPSDKLVADNNGSQTNDSGTQNVAAEDL